MRMVGSATLTLLLIVALPIAASGEPESTDARIARVEAGLLPPFVWKGEERVGSPLDQRMALFKVPGVSIAVLDDYELVWALGSGVVR